MDFEREERNSQIGVEADFPAFPQKRKRRKWPFVVLGVFLALVIAVVVLFSTLNRPRTAIDAREFQRVLEEAGHVVQDAMPEWEAAGAVSLPHGNMEAMLRVNVEEFLMEFISFSTEERTLGAFWETRNDMEAILRQGGGTTRHTELNFSNFNRFTLTASDHFMVISRIDNTIVFAIALEGNRDVINDILDQLGY